MIDEFEPSQVRQLLQQDTGLTVATAELREALSQLERMGRVHMIRQNTVRVVG